jgi:phage N-6-adenine-methyltransferase
MPGQAARQADLSIPDDLSIPGFLMRAGCAVNGTPDVHQPTMQIAPDTDAVEIGRLYGKAKSSAVDSVKYAVECGHRLIAKKAALKEQIGHGSWLPWLEANADTLGFDTRQTSAALMRAAAKCNASVTFDEPKALEFNRQIWGHAAPVRGTAGTGENEWYTPPEYLDHARAVLGEIDLDPASSRDAQRTVKAAEFFTLSDDGLKHEWRGRVWLNPPYAQPAIAHFVSKMMEERLSGRVTAAIMLTHNYTDTAWFQEAASVADAICFTRGRVRFIDSLAILQHRPKAKPFSISAAVPRPFGANFRRSDSSFFRGH